MKEKAKPAMILRSTGFLDSWSLAVTSLATPYRPIGSIMRRDGPESNYQKAVKIFGVEVTSDVRSEDFGDLV